MPLKAQGDSVMIGPKWRHCRTWVYPPIRSLGWSAFPPGDRWRICCFGSGENYCIPVAPRGGNHPQNAAKRRTALPHFQPTLGSEALPLKPLPLPLPLPYSADLESRERVLLHPAWCTGSQKLTPKQCCQGLFILLTIPPNVPKFSSPSSLQTSDPLPHPSHPSHPSHPWDSE